MTKSLLDRAIASLPKRTTLSCVAYDEQLDNVSCAKILDGKYDEVRDEIEVAASDSQLMEQVDYYLNDSPLNDKQRERLKANRDAFDRFVEECQERDDSRVFADMLRHTGRKMVRFHFTDDQPHNYGDFDEDGTLVLTGGSWSWPRDLIEDEARRIAAKTGLDFEANRDTLIEIVANAADGGRVCVLAYVEFKDIAEAVEKVMYGSQVVSITFDGTFNLLVHNRGNGSGHDGEVTGSVTFRIDAAAIARGVLRLDENGGHDKWNWSDAIASVAKSYYRFDPKITSAPTP